MPRQTFAKMVKHHLPQLLLTRGSIERADYLADMMAAEGLDPAAAVLAAYNKKHDDGLLVLIHLLKREQEFEGDIGDLLESLASSFPSQP
jgi:hypothetical protein